MGARAAEVWDEQARRYVPGRRETALLILAGIFLTHALLGEIVGGKLFLFGDRLMSVGVIPWPIVFVTTDLVNEYYGPRAVRRLTLLAVILILYAFAILWLCMEVEAAPDSPVDQHSFDVVFGQSLWIIVGSVVAFATSQLIDATVFVFARAATGGRALWVRALGSTVVSQLIDTFVIHAIAFGLPGTLSAEQVVELSFSNYGYKVVLALVTVPMIYFGHGVVDRFLDRDPGSQQR